MLASKIVRRPLLAAGVATVCLALGAGVSPAASPNTPEVGIFYQQEPFSEPFAEDVACLGSLTGTITGTDTWSGRFNNAPDFFHFESTLTTSYRIDLTDGRYIVGTATARIIETANAESGVTAQKDTETSRDRAVVYSAGGEPIATVRISATFHTTWTDADADRDIDPGELTASVDRFHVTCS